MAALPDIASGWNQGDEEDLTTIPKCYCPCCQKSNATTTMLPTKVPLFREIIVMNLLCDDCGFRSAEVNFGGEIQERGEKLTLTVTSPDELNRQIIKSDSCSLLLPQLEFEIPPGTQRGSISTMEGVFRTAADNLEQLQPERLRLGDVDNFHRCRKVIQNLRRYAGEQRDDDDDDSDVDQDEKDEGSIFPFQVVLDDPAGNSFIENPFAPKPDPNLKSEKYWRTPKQDMALGLQPSEEAVKAGTIDDSNPEHKNVVNVAKGAHRIEKLSSKKDDENLGRQEVMKFPTTCPHCHKEAETDMCVTDIPHFKEVIIMSLLCEHCGYKSNEIKGGGAIPKYGTKITLSIRGPDDLAREVLKSDTAGIAIPELELELEEGGLDGVYTTVEGLLGKLKERLQHANPFGSGDSAKKQHLTNDGGDFSGLSPNHERYLAFLAKLDDMEKGKVFPFTLVISDPLSNSFVGPVPKDAVALSLQAEKEGSNKCYDEYVDSGMDLEEYERTFDQNEILGLNDMKTENYQADGEPRLYHGTDKMEELPDRLRRLDVRGPDHPHEVGKAPVEGDVTIMGAGSANFAVPAMAKRGHQRAPPAEVAPNIHQILEDRELRKVLHDFEYGDEKFIMDDEYDGPKEGMVFKDGAQGLGYYQNIPLLELWERSQK